MGLRQSKLKIMFEKVRKASCDLHKNHKGKGLPNGKAFWQPLKELLKSTDGIIFAIEWLPVNQDLRKLIMALDDSKHVNHFLIQQVQIPTVELPFLRKIIQIALNVGQFEGVIKDKRISKFHKNSGLINLSTYVSSTNIEFISQQIPNSFIKALDKLL